MRTRGSTSCGAYCAPVQKKKKNKRKPGKTPPGKKSVKTAVKPGNTNKKGGSLKAATAVLQTGKTAKTKKVGVAGTWAIDDGTGTITISSNIRDANVDTSSFQTEVSLESPRSNPLVYTGETPRWENCWDNFKLEMTVNYDPDGDAIQVEIDVSPEREVDYGPSSAFGGFLSFTASREDDD